MHADLILTRFCYCDEGTFGRFQLPTGQTVYTVERPWLSNAPRLSCIPCGEYMCGPRPYHRGGYDAVEIKGVPGRSHILFHVGNYPSDVLGCIGVGERFAPVGTRIGVTNSRVTFKEFMRHYGGREFRLEIRSYEPAGMVPSRLTTTPARF